jgi:hypothetical protein
MAPGAFHLNQPAGLKSAQFLARARPTEPFRLRQLRHALSRLADDPPEQGQARRPGQDSACAPQGRTQATGFCCLHISLLINNGICGQGFFKVFQLICPRMISIEYSMIN